LYGGVITGLTIGLPVLDLLNCFCCGGVLLGGLLSVFFYTRDLSPEAPAMKSADALQLGALSGVFGALTGTVLQTGIVAGFGDVAREILGSMLTDTRILESLPNEVARAIEEMLAHEQSLSLPGVMGLLVIWMIVGPLFGLLGGLIGFAIFRPPQSSGIPMPGETKPSAE